MEPGPRGYFYALVTQLPISDLRSTVIYVLKLLSGLCLVDSEAKKPCPTQAETNQRYLYAHCTATHTCTLHHVHITVHYIAQVVVS